MEGASFFISHCGVSVERYPVTGIPTYVHLASSYDPMHGFSCGSSQSFVLCPLALVLEGVL